MHSKSVSPDHADNIASMRLIFITAILLVSQTCSSYRTGEHLPHPPIVSPGIPYAAVAPPSDALILFGGEDLSEWQKNQSGKKASWRVQDGFTEVKRLGGSISTYRAFGDVQLHIEWATPASGWGKGQHKGNSGIKFMGLYEVQILDSFHNETYPDGQAGAIYSQHPPLVNVSMPPGTWQIYDIIFLRPRFGEDGALIRPAYLTVWHNGVLIHNHAELEGPTKGNRGYSVHPDQLPLELQNHRSRVRFRNIWLRTLE